MDLMGWSLEILSTFVILIYLKQLYECLQIRCYRFN